MEGDNGGRPKRLRVTLTRVAEDPSDRPVRVESDGASEICGVPSPEIAIVVCDNGPGISTELREKIFYPFFTTKQGGSGVGLATAQKIVASHGGVLELDTGNDSGCSFRVRLPVGRVDS